MIHGAIEGCEINGNHLEITAKKKQRKPKIGVITAYR